MPAAVVVVLRPTRSTQVVYAYSPTVVNGIPLKLRLFWHRSTAGRRPPQILILSEGYGRGVFPWGAPAEGVLR